jgi:hypothetical protein
MYILYDNKQLKTTALMKSSTFYRNYRELMVGANQCGSIREWTSEPPNRTLL